MEKVENKSVVTLEKMNEFNSVVDAILWAENHHRQIYKASPSRPRLSNNPSSEEAREYANLLETYEKEMIEYNEYKKLSYEKRVEIQSVIVEYIKDHSGLNSIPEQYRSKVYSKASEEGGGFYEVYCKLEDLIEIFD